jgi:hypothetical protein
MALKEFREFFFRHTQVNSGTVPDQETGFALQYTIIKNGVATLVYNRLLRDDFPSEDVYRKLLESITFKLNPADRATNSLQGLAKTASDFDVLNRNVTSSYLDQMIRFVQPGQIPRVIGNNVVESTEIVSGTTRQTYEIQSDGILHHRITNSNLSGDTGGFFVPYSNINHQYTLPAGLLANTEFIEIEADFYKTFNTFITLYGFVVASPKTVKLAINNSIVVAEVDSYDFFDRFRMVARITKINATTIFVSYKFSKISSLLYTIGFQPLITEFNTFGEFFDNPSTGVGTGVITVPDMDNNATVFNFYGKIVSAGDLNLRRTMVTITKRANV